MSGLSRASIPNSVKKTIDDIKEIAGNHGDEEIYAMLKECSMDPNETIPKLLFQDTFHEVKRKRDKRKENVREVADTTWRPATYVRGGRGGRGNYIPRYTSHDIDTRRNIGVGKENGINEGGGKGSASTLSIMPLATEDKVTAEEHNSTISLSSMSNGPIKAEHQSSDRLSFSVGDSVLFSAVIVSKDGSSLGDGKFTLSSSGQGSSSTSIISATGVYAASSDPILLPSLDGHIPGVVGAIKCEVGMPRSVIDTTVGRGFSHDTRGSELPSLNRSVISEKSGNFVNGRVQENFQDVVGDPVPEIYQGASPSSSITGTSGSRPSSNYSNRSQNPSASIKAGLAKEWRPKSTIVNPASASGVLSISSVELHKGEAVTCSMPVTNSMIPDDVTKIQKKLEEFIISDAKHVIIPDHLQVSESERSGLSFGSFDSNFTLTMPFKNELDAEESPAESSESTRDFEENIEEFPSSTIGSPKVAEGKNCEIDQQPIVAGNKSEEVDIPSTISPSAESNQSKLEASLVSGLQHSIIHNAPVYPNFGFVPPMLGNPFPAFESSELQAHETARIPTFVVPQPFDPSANYYASIYRPAIDGDGRFSPLLAQGAATKYNGTIAAVSNQSGQSLQESGSSLVLSSAGSTPLVPQAAGVVQASIAAGQQPVPLFRQPAGVHISHYPPNYVHYSQYFSPFYAPSPASMHHFLGNAAAFHQQPSTGSLFPPTATTGTNNVKYPLSHYKPGTNNSLPGQGTYGLNPFVYSPAAVSGGNSAGSEDLASSQFKENNVFNNGQQSEGSAVWMSPAARDMPTFQAGSFYNIPPQGQPVAFAPPPAGHGAAAYAGIYHPAQPVAAGSVHPLLQQSQPVSGSSEIGGPPIGVYQQPHRASQMNWVNNY